MSTKTSIKRIALVAAAALTLGGFSAVSSYAGTNADVTGVSVSTTAPTTMASVTTPGTAAAPIAKTVVQGSTFYVGAATAAQNETVTVYSDSAFTTLVSPTLVETQTSITSGNKSAFLARDAGTTYYIKLDGGTANKGYAAVTTVPVLATTYDGTVGGTGSLTPSAVAGPANSFTVTAVKQSAATGTRGIISVSGAGASIASLDGVAVATAGTTSVTIPVGGANASTALVVINTPTVGSVVVTYSQETGANTGIYTASTSVVTATVNASGQSGTFSAANSTLYDTTTISNSVNASASLTSATGLGTASNTPVIEYSWSLQDVLGNAYSNTATTKLSAVVTGPGLLSTTYNSSASAAKAITDASNSSGRFYLYGDGTSGVATITVTVGSTTLGTKTVTFYSTTVASLSATVNHGIVNSAAVTGFAADTGTAGVVNYIAVTAKDATGNAIPSLVNLTASSSNTAIATAGTPTWDATDLVYYVPVTGVAKGSAVITVKDASATISATATINVAQAKIATWTAAFDKATYNAGDAAALTITAKDSDGNLVADGYYSNVLGGAFSTSQALTSTLFGTALHFKNGVASASFYAPYNSGTLVANALGGSSTTVLGSALQALAGATSLTASATITAAGGGDSSLALDAANAATDAANNAYDEAQNATQAASDALAAVKALAVQVKALIALVTKIKNKVGA